MSEYLVTFKLRPTRAVAGLADAITMSQKVGEQFMDAAKQLIAQLKLENEVVFHVPEDGRFNIPAIAITASKRVVGALQSLPQVATISEAPRRHVLPDGSFGPKVANSPERKKPATARIGMPPVLVDFN